MVGRWISFRDGPFAGAENVSFREGIFSPGGYGNTRTFGEPRLETFAWISGNEKLWNTQVTLCETHTWDISGLSDPAMLCTQKITKGVLESSNHLIDICEGMKPWKLYKSTVSSKDEVQLKVLETTILKLPSYGKISVLLGTLAVWLAPAGPAHWEQSGTVSQDGLGTHWQKLMQAPWVAFGTGPSPPHRLHSEVYCQEVAGTQVHQLAQLWGCPIDAGADGADGAAGAAGDVGDDGDGTAPLHSPTYCCELKGTHLNQSGRVSSIFTFSPVLADLVFESKTIGCSHWLQSEVFDQVGLETHWHPVSHPVCLARSITDL